jgi:hypothetical protein
MAKSLFSGSWLHWMEMLGAARLRIRVDSDVLIPLSVELFIASGIPLVVNAGSG